MEGKKEPGKTGTRSLAFDLTLIVFLVFTVGQGLLWAWFLSDQKQNYAGTLREKIAAAGKSFSEVSAPALQGGDLSQLDRYLQALGGDEDILSATLADPAGAVLKKMEFRPAPEGSSVLGFMLPGEDTLKTDVVSGGARLGTVEIKYTGKRMNGRLMRLLTVAPIGQLVVLLIMFSLIYYFARVKVGRPVREINSKLAAITGGDLTVEITGDGSSEIGSVASGLNFLKASLIRTVSVLNETAGNVGMAVKQLNLTFSNLSAGMKSRNSSIDEISVSMKAAALDQKKISDNTKLFSESSSENVSSLLEVKATADEIASGTNKLFQAVEGSYAALSQLSQTAKQIASNSEEALDFVEGTSASVEEINASLKEVEKSARMSTELAEGVRALAAEEGVRSSNEAIEAMETISGRVRALLETIKNFGSRSKDIEKMLTVIKGVTEQTNLLSLNAAILASQAGEYGKGFSVVADEMRALSERTSASTKEIAGVVTGIRSEIAGVMSSIEESMGVVERGKQNVYRARESTGEIVEKSRLSAEMALTIQRATEEQSRGLSQITSAVEKMRQTIQKMAGSTLEQFKGSEYLLEKMSDVKEIAEATRRGMQEQASGTKQISSNLAASEVMIRGIKESTVNQQALHDTIAASLEQIKAAGSGTLRDVEEVAQSLATLQNEIGALKKEVEAFRTNGKVHPV